MSAAAFMSFRVMFFIQIIVLVNLYLGGGGQAGALLLMCVHGIVCTPVTLSQCDYANAISLFICRKAAERKPGRLDLPRSVSFVLCSE